MNKNQDHDAVLLDCIFWYIHTKHLRTSYDGPEFELSWGWDAGRTEEQLKNTAEDSPRGKASVVLTLETATKLIEELTQLVEKHKSDPIPEWPEEWKETQRKFDEWVQTLPEFQSAKTSPNP